MRFDKLLAVGVSGLVAFTAPAVAQEPQLADALQRTFAAFQAGDTAEAFGQYLPDAQVFVEYGPLLELNVAAWLAMTDGIDWGAAEMDSRVLGRTAVTIGQVAGTLRLPQGVVEGPFRYSESRVRSGDAWLIVQQQITALGPRTVQADQNTAPPAAVSADPPPANDPSRAAPPEGRDRVGPPALGAPDPPSLDAYVVPRIQGEVTFDGRVNEAAWEAVEPLEAVVHYPTFGAPLTERTEFRMAYDDDYIYFSCRAYDSEPERILVYSLERDETGFASDFCSIYLDTLNDEENALQFKTGPAANRADSQRMNDGEVSDNSWNAFWDAASSRDSEGWYTEIRVPFSSLLFQPVDGRVVMGASMLRNISRKNERHVHPAIRPDAGTFAYTKPSLMRKFVFDGIESRGIPTYVTPYVLGGDGYTHALSASGTEYDQNNDRVHEGGLDVRLGVTSNSTLDLTVNTDFAQVEADDQQVNLSRFSLFFPEKRRFFQERSANFEYSLGGQDRLFHSRTIGLAGGRPVRIYGGGRLVGRVGDWDVGFLDLQTDESTVLPSENLGVARVRRRVLNANSYIGGIFTSRVGSGGHHNLVYGVDGIFRVGGADYLVINWAQSFDDQESAADGSIEPLDRGLARLNWQRRGQDRWTYSLDLARTGEVFDPGMGFLRQQNYTRGQANLAYGWRRRPGARFYTYSLGLGGGVLRRNEDATIETVEVEPTASLQTWGLHQLTLSAPFTYENLASPFSLPEGTGVPAGEYHFASGRLQYSAPQGDRIRPNVTLEGGQFYDGNRMSVNVAPTWYPSAHLNMEATYRLDRVEFPDRDQSFTTHLARLRAQVMVSTTMSAVGFVQYTSAQNSVIANLRLRYNPREGNDLYIVWNEVLVTDRTSFAPVRPFSQERTLLVKYSHTFQLGL